MSQMAAHVKQAQAKLACAGILLKRAQASKRKAVMQKLAQVIAKQARCWEGYEPVPGKPAYSDNSCRPVGSKKKEKQAIDFTHPGTIAGLGALAGGLGGFASDPDEDERGRPKSRLNNALLGGLAGGALGYGAGHGLNWLMRKPPVGNTNALGAAAGGTNIGAIKAVTTVDEDKLRKIYGLSDDEIRSRYNPELDPGIKPRGVDEDELRNRYNPNLDQQSRLK